MREEVLNDLNSSKEAFKRFVAPELIKALKLKSIVSVEDSNNPLFKQMDMLSGIDYFILEDGIAPATLASRVLWHTDPVKFEIERNDLTVRYTRPNNVTEYPKVSYAIEHNLLYPMWTCTAYMWGNKNDIDNNVFAGLNIWRTDHLYKVLKEELKDPIFMHFGKNRSDQTTFLAINIKEYALGKKSEMYKLWEYNNSLPKMNLQGLMK